MQQASYVRFVVLACALLHLSSALNFQREGASGNKRHHKRVPKKRAKARKLAANEHYWPHGRGRVGLFGTSQDAGPRDLSGKPAWTWQHPEGRFHTTIVGSPLIDQSLNVYLATEDGVRKFDPKGKMLWKYEAPGPIGACPSLLDGAVFGSSQNGFVFSVDMDSGRARWAVNVSASVGGGAGFVEAHDSVVVAAADAQADGGNARVVCLNSTNGHQLWDFLPERPVYNFAPLFAENRTLLFQDGTSGLYRLGLNHGKVIWRKPGQELMAPEDDDDADPGSTQPSHTDGGVALGSNGVVYSIGVWGTSKGTKIDTPGAVYAHRVSDGRLLWYRQMPRPPNSVPTVARLGKSKDATLSVVVPMGKPPALPVLEHMPWWMPESWRLAFHKESVKLGDEAIRLWHNRRQLTELVALNAETGEAAWSYDAPSWSHVAGAGDEEGLLERRSLGHRSTCQPPPWTAPTVDADGTIYVGHESGKFMAIRDKNHDGKIAKKHEVSMFDAGAGFLQPAALAPGVLAVASCDTLFVFSDEAAGAR